MIVYILSCESGHRFEAWFRDSSAFDGQQRDGALSCPVCESRRIHKAPSAPHIARSRNSDAVGADEGKPEKSQDVAEMLVNFRRHIESTCDYVGEAFAEEARRIHYGEAEKRNIYGEATRTQEGELRGEGIAVTSVPWLVRRNG